jgi:hypothetical protein
MIIQGTRMSPCLPRAAFWSVSLPFRALWMRKKRSQKYDPSYQEAQHCLFAITLLLQLSQQSQQQMAVVTIPENSCGKTRTACSEFDVYHPDLGHGQLKDLNRIQSIVSKRSWWTETRRMWHKHEIERPKRKRVHYSSAADFNISPYTSIDKKCPFQILPTNRCSQNQLIPKLISKKQHSYSKEMFRGWKWAQREIILTDGKIGEVWKYVPPEKTTNI